MSGPQPPRTPPPAPRRGGEGTLDPARWLLLREDVGDRALRAIAETYLALLPVRLDGTRDALAEGRRRTAATLLTDLSVGSGVLGADRLAAAATAVEATVRRMPDGQWVPGRLAARSSSQWARLRTQARLAEHAVRRALAELPPDAPPPGR